MKSLFTFLIFICTAYAYNLTCSDYTCDDKIVQANEQCGYEEINKVDLHLCNGTKLVCQPLELDSQSVCVPVVIPDRSILPGELCEKDQECISGTCSKEANSTCTGVKEGKGCDLTAQCDKGLYCHNKTCNQTGYKCDEQGYGCSINQICDRGSGTCHLIGSIKNDQPAPSPAACQSYYQDQNGNCKDGPKLDNVKKLECPTGETECEYKNNNGEIEKLPCVCAKAKTDKKYCALGKGNMDVNDVIFTLRNS